MFCPVCGSTLTFHVGDNRVVGIVCQKSGYSINSESKSFGILVKMYWSMTEERQKEDDAKTELMLRLRDLRNALQEEMKVLQKELEKVADSEIIYEVR